MDRINRDDVDRIAASISDSLQNGLYLEVQGRNGYTALDLYDSHGMIMCLTTGTKREVYTYLQGMRRFALLTNRMEF